MGGARTSSWEDIRSELKRRIAEREWLPGSALPNEVDLAGEFGCARATVNRAMQSLASEGLLERRRKSGTRVRYAPVRKAVFEISILREEVEGRGAAYSQRVLRRETGAVPREIAARLRMEEGAKGLAIDSLHFADGRPYALEKRWINPSAVPGIGAADFTRMSVNEWLVRNAPYTGGTLAFGAANASDEEAGLLETEKGCALFVLDRVTWAGETGITCVRIAYAPGFRMETVL